MKGASHLDHALRVGRVELLAERRERGRSRAPKLDLRERPLAHRLLRQLHLEGGLDGGRPVDERSLELHDDLLVGGGCADVVDRDLRHVEADVARHLLDRVRDLRAELLSVPHEFRVGLGERAAANLGAVLDGLERRGAKTAIACVSGLTRANSSRSEQCRPSRRVRVW